MIKGTRFFSRRLLPLLLAAVMLLGMLPALTLPVLAEEPPASQKLTNTTDTAVTYQGAVGTGRAPSLVVDGDTSHNDNKYFVVGNDQPQEKNETKPVNPTYWIQLDLGKKYSLTEMKLFVYHGRALKNLVVLASDSSTFDTYSIIWNADKENFFGLGAGDKEQFPNATVAGDMLTSVDAEGSDVSRSAEVTLTKNTGTDAVTYYFRYSLDGTTLAEKLTATVPGTGGGTQPTEPSVTDYSVAPTELPSNGGIITVTLTGTNLQNGIQIKAGTITAQTSGDAAKQMQTLTLPANYSSSSVSYTVQYSLNGVDWVGGKTVRVSGRYTPPVGPVTPSVPTKPGVPERDSFPFTDVSRSSWYYDSVRAAWEKDLIDGVTRTLYKPDDTLTVAQAIKLSAALHQMLNNNGKVTLRNGSPYWYSSYVSYAVDNGIIEKMYLDYTPAQMNTPVKRNEFVHIFYGAMSDYRQINTVADNKIPDVITTDTYALEIYTFYRAGILTGSDKNGTFYPTNDIKRSEVAAILSRMYDKTARKTVSLP